MTLPETITLYVVREAGPVKHWTWSFDLDYTYDKYGDRQYLQETMEDYIREIYEGYFAVDTVRCGKQYTLTISFWGPAREMVQAQKNNIFARIIEGVLEEFDIPKDSFLHVREETQS